MHERVYGRSDASCYNHSTAEHGMGGQTLRVTVLPRCWGLKQDGQASVVLHTRRLGHGAQASAFGVHQLTE